MSFTILTDNDKKITQPNSIKIDLMNHQKTMIYKMLEIETSGSIKVPDYSMKKYSNMINITGKEAEINTNIAILGDKVGSGKTLMIITLLTVKKIINERQIEMGGTQFYSVKIKPSSPLIRTNLIIVPHKILPQWKEAFEKYSSNLKVYTISFNKEIDKIIKTKKEIKKNWNEQDLLHETEEIIKEKIEEYDVVIIGETMYKRFYKTCQNYRFSRILIDEADTIKLPRDMSCQFNFIWLITGTPKGLFYSNKPFISKIFKDDILNLNSNFVIKNEDSFIEQSIKLPHPKRFKIKCITPRELDIIKDLIPPSILQMINAGNSDQAIKALNCNIDTNENILQVITKNLMDSIENKKIELDAESRKHYPVNLQKEHEQKIKFIENQIEKLINKYEDIKKRIYQLNDTTCPVCMGEFTNPVMVSCCNNTFCFDCLAVSLGELKNNKCPYCRQGITTKHIHIFQSDTITKNNNLSVTSSNKYELKDKLDVLVDLVQNKPDGSFMIFAGYMETFNKIETKLKDLSISYHILKGQSSTVKKHIDDFREKKVRILMLNAQFFGAGMNLQMATDIIMYHRFTKEMEEQIIGRAQRLGRSINDPLNVYYLLHDNESDNIEDNFKFEDQTNIHYMDWLEQEKNDKLNQSNKNLNNDDIIYTIDSENDINKFDKFNLDFDNQSNSENNKLYNDTNLIKINNDKIFIKTNQVANNKIKIEMDDDDIINNFIKENNLEEIKKKNLTKILLTTDSTNTNIIVNSKFKNDEIDINIEDNFDIDQFEVIS